jgi:hypothetical protein
MGTDATVCMGTDAILKQQQLKKHSNMTYQEKTIDDVRSKSVKITPPTSKYPTG